MTTDSIAKANAQLERQPADADAWYKKGEAHRQSGDIATAISAYNQSLKLKPDFAQACYALAESLEANGKTDLAIKTYGHWLKIIQAGAGKPPMVADANTVHIMERLVAQGEAHMNRGELAEAQAAYEKLLAMNPYSPAGLTNLAAVYFRMRRLEEAEKLLCEVLRIKPGYVTALNILGGCFKDTKRLLPAIAAYKNCIDIDPNFINAWSNLGKCYLVAVRSSNIF